MRLSVIIPNYNGLALLQKYLESTYRILANELADDFEIIITDDHSRDGSDAFVASLRLPKVRFLTNPHERGFGSNCNNGARHARGEALFFLNNDIELKAGFFQPLLNKLAEQQVFSVVPQILRRRDNVIESLTSGILVPGEIKTRSKNISNKDPALNHRILWGCGAALMCKREIFLSLGGFSDEFKVYYVEDTDLSVKAWRMGYQNWYVGESIAIHDNSVTTQKDWKWKKRLIAGINGEIFQFKHLPEKDRQLRFRRLLGQHLRTLNLFRAWIVIAAYSSLRKNEPNYLFGIDEILRELNRR